MSWRTPLCILIGFLLVGCGGDDEVPTIPPDTTAPYVSLTASADTIQANGILTLTAGARDSGTVREIMFFEGTTLLAVKSRAPYTTASTQEDKSFTHDIAMTSVDNGAHLYHATAVDGAGNTATTSQVRVDVLIPNFPHNDDFNDNQSDPLQWGAEEFGGPTVSETNGRLELEVPGNSAGVSFSASFGTICDLSGDFDAQADYELLEWPANAGVRLALVVSGHASGRCYFFNEFGLADLHFADLGQSVGSVAATGVTGKLRLTRAGDTWTAYHWDGATWQVTHTTTSAVAADYDLKLAVWSHDGKFGGQQVRVAFDNFVLNSGTPVGCD